jgi:hypothetical protein
MPVEGAPRGRAGATDTSPTHRAVAYRRAEQSGRPRLRSPRLSTAGARYGLIWQSDGEELLNIDDD